MESPTWHPLRMRAWAILLLCTAVAVAGHPFQPFTGSLALVVALALAVGFGGIAVAAAFRRA